MQKISIIVPVYNVERYINRCIDSILKQTYDNFELILIDDGSPDNCGQICEDYTKIDSRVQCIHQKNAGLSGARNAGLKIATGDYICFVDSDDAIHEDYLRVLVDTIESQHADVAVCDRIDVYDDNLHEHDIGKLTVTEFNKQTAMRQLVKNQILYQTVWDKLYRREAIGDLRFPVGKLHEDEFFTWKVLLKCEIIAVSDAPLYYYFHRSGSIMETFSPKRLDFFEARYERHIYLLEYFPELTFDSKSSIAFPCILVAQKLLKTKNKKLITKCMPKLQYYYKKTRFSIAEVVKMPLRTGIWYALANCSLRLSALIRILINRPT